MAGECFCESLVLFHQCFLETLHTFKVILAQQCPAGVDFLAVVVAISPAAGDVVVFEGKTEWVDPRMASSTGWVLAMCGKLFADRQILCRIIIVQWRDIIRGRWWRIIEDHFNHPSPSCDRMSPLRARIHTQHRGVGDDAAIPLVRDCHSFKSLSSQFVPQVIFEPPLRRLL